MGNCCSTEAAAVVTRRSGGGDKDDVQAVAVPYAALPPSPRKYADTEDTEPRAKEEEDDDEAEEQPASASPSSGSSQPQADAFAPGPSAKHAENTHHVKIGDYNLRYSYYSKRGYYPEARKKANQDSYYCETHFAGDAQKAFFAVFDGHGQYGDICSQFAAEQLPENIIKNLEDNVGILPALTRAHVQTNRAVTRPTIVVFCYWRERLIIFLCGLWFLDARGEFRRLDERHDVHLRAVLWQRGPRLECWRLEGDHCSGEPQGLDSGGGSQLGRQAPVHRPDALPQSTYSCRTLHSSYARETLFGWATNGFFFHIVC